jgi:hypothetical protein
VTLYPPGRAVSRIEDNSLLRRKILVSAASPWSAFSVFFLQSPSFLDYQRRMQ